MFYQISELTQEGNVVTAKLQGFGDVTLKFEYAGLEGEWKNKIVAGMFTTLICC